MSGLASEAGGGVGTASQDGAAGANTPTAPLPGPGFYAAALTPSERQRWREALALDGVQAEAALVRTLLRREAVAGGAPATIVKYVETLARLVVPARGAADAGDRASDTLAALAEEAGAALWPDD